MPTLVTPSMSFSAARKRATASVLAPQPISSSAGPGIDARLATDAPSPAWVSGVAEPATRTSHTSGGITRASSFSTRSQSNRLLARLLTVASRDWEIDAKSEYGRRAS